MVRHNNAHYQSPTKNDRDELSDLQKDGDTAISTERQSKQQQQQQRRERERQMEEQAMQERLLDAESIVVSGRMGKGRMKVRRV